MARSHGRCEGGEIADGLSARTPQDHHAGRRVRKTVWSRRWRWMGRSTATGSRPMSAMYSSRPCGRRHRHHGQPLQPQTDLSPRLIEEAGATFRFLPPYSPDFNPIEMAFAKLKALLRKAAERTVALWNAIGRFIDCFIPKNARTTSPPQDTMQTDRNTL